MKTKLCPARVYSAPVPSALPITIGELLAFGLTVAEIEKGESLGQIKSFGPWQIPISFRALCVSSVYVPKDQQRYTAERRSETVYGVRTLCKARESGYCLEGRVSVAGRNVRGFTSSQLFELPGGKLVNVATIHACL